MIQDNAISMREQVLELVTKEYKTQAEYLWKRYPKDAILRNPTSDKWYGLLMTVSKDKLGLVENDIVDVLNVKVEPVMIDSFLLKDGFFPGYHMNKNSWLTILLDGTVPMETIEMLLDVSYRLTEKRKD